jgi:hypothetical protein
MKRIFHVVVMTVALLGITGGLVNISTAHAKSIQGRSALGVNALYVIPGNTDISDFNMTLEVDSAVGYGLTYTHGFKSWAMDVSLDRSNHDIKVNDSGSIRAIPASTSIASNLPAYRFWNRLFHCFAGF